MKPALTPLKHLPALDYQNTKALHHTTWCNPETCWITDPKHPTTTGVWHCNTYTMTCPLGITWGVEIATYETVDDTTYPKTPLITHWIIDAPKWVSNEDPPLESLTYITAKASQLINNP